MIIENEFSVRAKMDAVWRELLDMEGVATCLPGATIHATEKEGVYDGSMRLKIGPMRVEYRGTATLSEIDEQSHTAVISLSAREAKGQGSAMATIRNRLQESDSGTRVTAQTELHITGPQAQFGRGVIEDVGRRVLDEFSQRLEQRLTGAANGSVPSAAEAAPDPAARAADPGAPTSAEPRLASVPAELDVGSLLTRLPAVRIGAAIVLAALVLIVLRRRR
jgi:carbon monoxide dehydrogenase subunit G